MNREQLEILAASAVDLIAGTQTLEYKGSISNIYERLKDKWPGEFGYEDLKKSLQLLVITNTTFLRDDEISSDLVRISPYKFHKYFEDHDTGSAARNYEQLYQYHHLGSEWLSKAWSKYISDAASPQDDFAVIDQDEEARGDAQLALLEIESSILRGNEEGLIFGDDKEAVAEEVGILRMAISKSKVRVQAVKEMAKRTLGYIIEKASGAAIAELAKKALQQILDWLT